MRFLLPSAALAVSLVTTSALGQTDAVPRTYELMINGESFAVRENKVETLTSVKSGAKYVVTLRIAPTQRMELNTVQFDYDWLFRVEDDRGQKARKVRLSHELGFTITINDLGGPLDPEQQGSALKDLVQEVAAGYQAMQNVKAVKVEEPHHRKFGDTSASGDSIRFIDAEDIRHVCLVYVISGRGFAVTCLIQFLEEDFDEIKGLIQGTLESFQPLVPSSSPQPPNSPQPPKPSPRQNP